MTAGSSQKMRDRGPQRFPIVIASWPRHNGEIVRIALDSFKKSYTIDIRCWWQDHRDGVLKPKKDGLTLAVAHLPKLAEFVIEALRRAERLGLVDPTD